MDLRVLNVHSIRFINENPNTPEGQLNVIYKSIEKVQKFLSWSQEHHKQTFLITDSQITEFCCTSKCKRITFKLQRCWKLVRTTILQIYLGTMKWTPDKTSPRHSSVSSFQTKTKIYLKRQHRDQMIMNHEGTGQPVELTMCTKCSWAGLNTSDRLLLEAVR